MNLKIAQLKIIPAKGDLEQNHRLMMIALKSLSVGPSPDVIITPECFLDGYLAAEPHVSADDLRQYAVDPSDCPHITEVAQVVKKLGCWFIYGCTRKDPNGRLFNSALIFDRQAQLAGIYDKLHLQDHDKKFSPGQKLPVFGSDFGTFGVMICADRRWPETARTLTLKGARIIFNPTYGMSCDLNLALMRTRAYENGIFIAFTHPRQSLITGPEGQVITNNEHPDIPFVLTTLTLDTTTTPNNHITDRRPDIYNS